MGKYSAAMDLGLNTRVRWYVVANRTDAVFYGRGKDKKFHFIDRLTNKRGHLRETELVSDKPGTGFSSAGGGTIHHGLDRRFEQHEQVAQRFARKIAFILDSAYRAENFRDLVLVAEPHFLGLLRAELSPPVRDAVKFEVPREYAQGSDEKIQKQIMEAIGA
ncbi:MAG: host attachment protein [Oligoflexia bacterium]|nr:host attachment protein [Oligoflexia bacterium]